MVYTLGAISTTDHCFLLFVTMGPIRPRRMGSDEALKQGPEALLEYLSITRNECQIDGQRALNERAAAGNKTMI